MQVPRAYSEDWVGQASVLKILVGHSSGFSFSGGMIFVNIDVFTKIVFRFGNEYIARISRIVIGHDVHETLIESERGARFGVAIFAPLLVRIAHTPGEPPRASRHKRIQETSGIHAY